MDTMDIAVTVGITKIELADLRPYQGPALIRRAS